MHESVLARAALPVHETCLGRRLLPYSIGHELWLTRENCSVLQGRLEGLPAAVLTCSRTWTELQSIHSWRWASLDAWFWRARIARMNARTELARFLKYRNDGLLEFPSSEIEKPGRSSARMPGAPFILRLQQWLMSEPLRLSEAAAWDYPVGLAKMRWAAHWESEGGYEIKSDGESEFDEFVRDGREKAKAATHPRPRQPTNN